MLSSQLSKQAKVRETIMILAIIAGILYLAFDYLYFPKKEKNTELIEQISALTEREASIRKLMKALEQRHTKMQDEVKQQSLTTKSKDTRILMITKYKKSLYKNVSDFLNSVMQQTYQSSVNVDAIKQDTPKEKKGYEETGFSLKFNGRFPNIIDFIQNLESIPALITLDTLEIRVSKLDVNMVNVDIAGTFFKLENANALY